MPVTTLLLTPPHAPRGRRPRPSGAVTEQLAAADGLETWIPLVPRVFDRILWVTGNARDAHVVRDLTAPSGASDADEPIVEFVHVPEDLIPGGTEKEPNDIRIIDAVLTVSPFCTSGRFVKATAFRSFPGIPRLLSRLAPECVAAIDAAPANSTAARPAARLTDVMVFDSTWYREHLLGRFEEWSASRPGGSCDDFLRESLRAHTGDPRVLLRLPVDPASPTAAPLLRGLALPRRIARRTTRRTSRRS